MKVQITPLTAFGFLQEIDSRHPWVLATEHSSGGLTLKFALLIDGTPSPHCVCLDEYGVWTMSTEVEP